jgi:hypothetical protein
MLIMGRGRYQSVPAHHHLGSDSAITFRGVLLLLLSTPGQHANAVLGVSERGETR